MALLRPQPARLLLPRAVGGNRQAPSLAHPPARSAAVTPDRQPIAALVALGSRERKMVHLQTPSGGTRRARLLAELGDVQRLDDLKRRLGELAEEP
jgi:hypothetical protein